MRGSAGASKEMAAIMFGLLCQNRSDRCNPGSGTFGHSLEREKGGICPGISAPQKSLVVLEMILVGFNRFYFPLNIKNARVEVVKSIYGVIDLPLAIDQLNPGILY